MPAKRRREGAKAYDPVLQFQPSVYAPYPHKHRLIESRTDIKASILTRYPSCDIACYHMILRYIAIMDMMVHDLNVFCMIVCDCERLDMIVLYTTALRLKLNANE